MRGSFVWFPDYQKVGRVSMYKDGVNMQCELLHRNGAHMQ